MSGTARSQPSPTQLIEEIFGIDERDASLWLTDISRAGGILSDPAILPPPTDRRNEAKRRRQR